VIIGERLKIVSNLQVMPDIYKIVLKARKFLPIKAGHFINISVNDPSKILKRPFCIYDYDKKTGLLTVCYQIKGKTSGTYNLSQQDGFLTSDFPLGNCFADFIGKHRNIALVGGGIGVFPLYLLKEEKDIDFSVFVGFKDKKTADALSADFKVFKKLSVITDEQGFVTDKFKADGKKFDAVFACGPKAMLKALKSLNLAIPVYASLEERMGCGIGGCITCVCNVGGKNLRVCKDGPIFNLAEVAFDE